MKLSGPKPLSDILAATLNQLGISAKIKQHEVLDIWEQIVGEQIARVATAENIRDGKLFISVKNSTWRNELLYLKQEIIQKINSRMNQEIINDIIFR
jgi:predicted nucleic acid-binding Zn ribbon protein